jgi:hypothetical protein
MIGHPVTRGVCCLGLVAALCAVGGTAWYLNRPGDATPPLPNLPSLQEEEQPDDDSLSLAEADRTYLWDLEHHGNLLNAHGFSKLARALREADTRTLTACLAEDFKGELLQEPRETQVQSEVLQVVRLEDAGRPARVVGREEFVGHLLEYRRLFGAKPPEAQLVVKYLRPQRGRDLDGPWQGLAFLRVWGETEPGHPCEVVLTLGYEVARPTQEGLAQPGWLRAARVRQSLVGRANSYLMADVTRQCGLDPSVFHDNWNENLDSPKSRIVATGGVYVCDFDRDGILDLLVTDINRYALYRGTREGKFIDVTTEVGLPRLPVSDSSISGTACWIDIDGDGWEDLILGGHIYRNRDGQRFEDYTQKARLPLPRDTIALVVADYDSDGRLDLYATRTGAGTPRSWLKERGGAGAGNRLFRNLGNWQFEDVTEKSNTGGGKRSTFTAVWLDANNDGKPDLHVINEWGNGVLLENLGNGTFREHDLGPGPVDYGSMGVAAGDIDNDGNIDIYCADMYSKAGSRVIGNLPSGSYPEPILARMRRFVAGSQLHLNKGGFRFEQVGEKMQVNAVGWPHGAALADLDNDGWLDVFGTAGFISRDRSRPDG